MTDLLFAPGSYVIEFGFAAWNWQTRKKLVYKGQDQLWRANNDHTSFLA
ncbi:hypothetical protein ACU8KH_05354 [Lachancea thermotolerans]